MIIYYFLFLTGKITKRGRILKATAVPSQNLPLHQDTLSVPGPSNREQRYRKRKRSEYIGPSNEETCDNEATHNEAGSEADIETAARLRQLLSASEEQNISESDIDGVVQKYSQKNEFKVRDSEVQVNTYRMTTLCDLLNTETALRSFTGLNNFDILNCLEHALKKEVTDLRSHRLSRKERLILTMVKLKLDVSYITLAALFNISGQLCKTYFFDMLTVLSKVLKHCIYFPTSEEISKNIPESFKCFAGCRVILDCIEITIQKPSCLCCRIKFYSQYKRNPTVKFMTGVSPAGTITFISNAYGGRASDKLIFEESNIINLLDANKDSIMVDKGFLIDDICAMFKINLIRPPFLRNKKQLSAEEALINQQIASARVHIERSNQRLKIFNILNGKLQWSLVPKIDEIFTIICGITNLSPSILSDDRF